MKNVLVVGLGNALRGDDAVGLSVAQIILDELPEARAIAWEGEPIGLLDVWAGEDLVILVDAVSAGAAPGNVVRLDASVDELPAVYNQRGSHAMGLGEAIELARALNRLPPKVIVYGIEGAAFAAGEAITEAAARAVTDVAARIVADVRQPVR